MNAWLLWLPHMHLKSVAASFVNLGIQSLSRFIDEVVPILD
jgi:hypothetical protein